MKYYPDATDEKINIQKVNVQVTNRTQSWLHSQRTLNYYAILPPVTFIPLLTKFDRIAHNHGCLRLLSQTW